MLCLCLVTPVLQKWTNRSSCRLGVADLPTGPRNHVLVGNPDPQTGNDFRGHVSDIGQSQQTARSRGVTPRQCRLSLPLLQQLVKVSSVYGTTVTHSRRRSMYCDGGICPPTPTHLLKKEEQEQKAPLPQTDRATQRVSQNLANCCTTV